MTSSVKFAAIEDRIAFFHRERLSHDVHEAKIRLRPGQTSEYHFHTVTRDTFYVLEGSLEVRVVCRQDPTLAYTAVGHVQVTVEEREGRSLHRLTLRPGDVVVVHPKVVHASANVSDAECGFICLEGPGEYDFIRCAPMPEGEEHAI